MKTLILTWILSFSLLASADDSFFKTPQQQEVNEITDAILKLKADALRDMLENGIPHGEFHDHKDGKESGHTTHQKDSPF